MDYQEKTFEELLQKMRRLRKMTQVKKPFGKCHPAAFYTLVKIEDFCEEQPEAPGISMGELAGQLDVSVPAVSKMVRGLEEKHLVERRSMPENRRVVCVCLTPAGRLILEEAEQQERQRMRRMAEALGEDDVEHLIRIVGKLCELEKNSREVDRC